MIRGPVMRITKVTRRAFAAIFLIIISLPLYAQDNTKAFITSIQKGDVENE
jgi:hypothetical protein